MHKPSAHIIFIVLLGVIPYLNTLHVPFLFDDLSSIVNNAAVKDLGNLWPPAGVRWFGYLTFALNYALGGLNPVGYHIVNLAIHAINAVLLYRLVLLTFRTPFFRGLGAVARNDDSGGLIALFSAALFASHPVQTQAVTYIVQRIASLATLFYLLAVILYIQARLGYQRLAEGSGQGTAADKRKVLLWYVMSLVSAVIAMKTKETAFTVPVIIVLYEFSFFPAPGKGSGKRLLLLLPVLLTLLIIPFSLVGPDGTGMREALRATTGISREDYLLTQFRVIVTYLRLLVFPVNQTLDYDYPLYRSFGDPAVLFSFLFLTGLAVAACWLFFRARRADSRELRLIAFGIFWFFITLSVESSIIPIADVIFEHRLYLPSAGAFLAMTTLVFLAAKRLRSLWPFMPEAVLALALCAIILLQAATFRRNRVWHSEVELWEDVLEKNPGHARAHAIIGLKYMERGGTDAAIEHFRNAILLKPDYAEAHVALGNAYVTKGRLDEGLREYLAALNLGTLDSPDTAMLTMNIGTYYLGKKQPDKAIEYYSIALSIVPQDAMVHHNLGLAYQAKGLKAKAEEEFRNAHLLNPEKY